MNASELEPLIDLLLDGTADTATVRRVQELLARDPAARAHYVEQMRLHALLQWRHGLAERARRPKYLPVHAWRWTAAAAVLLALALGVWALRRAETPPPFAQVAALEGVAWESGEPPLAVGEAIGAQQFRLQSGTLKVQVESGATVTLHGPADAELLSPLKLRLRRGKVVVRMEPPLTGFQVETPTSEVTDLGTEFGTEVGPTGRTDVVVFAGQVDVARRAVSATQRLTRGEALRIEPDGVLRRIAAIERRQAGGWAEAPLEATDSLIASVTDNFRGLESLHYYQIVPHGLSEDAPAYVDRVHQWNGVDAAGIPVTLRGADLVMPFNDDKRKADLEITLTLRRPALLSVFFDDRVPPPAWLRERFTDSGLKIALDEGDTEAHGLAIGVGAGVSIDRVFSVWQRRVEQPGPITLGPMAIKNLGGKAMYGIAATPLRRQP